MKSIVLSCLTMPDAQTDDLPELAQPQYVVLKP
jgi:hypothetical protein